MSSISDGDQVMEITKRLGPELQELVQSLPRLAWSLDFRASGGRKEDNVT